MAQSLDSDPYRTRASLEREMAGRSSDPSVKRIHENLARMYDALSGSYEPEIPVDLRPKQGSAPPPGPLKHDGEGIHSKH